MKICQTIHEKNDIKLFKSITNKLYSKPQNEKVNKNKVICVKEQVIKQLYIIVYITNVVINIQKIKSEQTIYRHPLLKKITI